MADIVNDYFKRFYPDPIDRSRFEYTSMLGGMERYNVNGVSSIFPEMVCADGFKMSVQGHYGAYSCPRDDFADHYSSVEVGFPSEREDLLMPFIDGGEETDPTTTVYGYVPIGIVEKVIEKHGGLVVA